MTATFTDRESRISGINLLKIAILGNSQNEAPLIFGNKTTENEKENTAEIERINDLTDAVISGWIGAANVIRETAKILKSGSNAQRELYCDSFRYSNNLLSPLIADACDCLKDSAFCNKMAKIRDFPATASTQGFEHLPRIKPLSMNSGCSHGASTQMWIWAITATVIAVIFISLTVVFALKKK